MAVACVGAGVAWPGEWPGGAACQSLLNSFGLGRRQDCR